MVFPTIRVRVPATSANLGPGFDALGLALDLWNETTFDVADSDELAAEGEGAAELQGVHTSIAHEAARRVWTRLGLPTRGVRLHMLNRVPFSRGLGSSSAAIVAGLVGANEWAASTCGSRLSADELLEEATRIEGHPDNVAPALRGGLQVAVQTESGRVVALESPVEKWPFFVVWVPDAHLATTRARGVLAPQVARDDAIFNLARSALLISALASGQLSALSEALRDRLHQDARAPLVPGFETIRAAAREAGALEVTLSGAGPSLLCWCETSARANNVKSALLATGQTGRAECLTASKQGASLME